VPNQVTFARQLAAEAVGTALLLAAVVGSGIMGERLAGGNAALALLANTLATGATLVTLILTFGPISGAHFNPAVTLANAWRRGIALRNVAGYIGAQAAGAFLGVASAHLMFGEPLFAISHHDRSGPAQLVSEFIATFGLLAVIWGCVQARSQFVPFAVGAYITGAYWFTSSTSFANPAVTLARSATDTYSGIRPADVPGFVMAQLLGAFAASALFAWFAPKTRVLILCTDNSARSQMAEGLLRHESGDRFAVYSAGTKPSVVRPGAVAVMSELGIDISGHRSKSVDEFRDQPFDFVITVCDNAKEACPVFPGKTQRLHWSFSDPAAVEGSEAERQAAFRSVRNQIHDRLKLYISMLP
jgi:thioredoxin type arsenate reductase